MLTGVGEKLLENLPEKNRRRVGAQHSEVLSIVEKSVGPLRTVIVIVTEERCGLGILRAGEQIHRGR